MNDSDLEFAALDELYERPSLAESPLTLAVRGAPAENLQAVCDRATTLLAGRTTPDEILLLTETEPRVRPPSRFGRLSVRTVALSAARDGAGLEFAISHAAWPVLVCMDAEASLAHADVKLLVDRLQAADVVVGRRRDSTPAWPFARLADWAVRKLFGVPTGDPLSPFKALRRDAARGIPLSCTGALGDFELLAKLTFVTAIHDDPELSVAVTTKPSIVAEMRARWTEVRRLFSAPEYFRAGPQGLERRIRPQDCGPPSRSEIATAVVAMRRPRIRPVGATWSRPWMQARSSAWTARRKTS